MKGLFLIILITFTSLSTVWASESTDKDILASRGMGVITQEDFTARTDKIPEVIRPEIVRNSARLQEMLNNMLLSSQLANAAREAGFDKNKVVQDRMRLAADTELGQAWLDHYVNSQQDADYDAMSQEYYELNKAQFLSKPEIDVSHILISNENRSKEEADAIAAEVVQQLNADPAQFEALVAKYSEDPSAVQNKGHFKGVKQGDMVKPFETVAFAMQEGEISEPVQTRFGLHIIRLDKQIPSRQLSYDEVKPDLINQQLSSHRERLKNAYLTELSQKEVNMTEQALELMVQRQKADK